MKITPGLVFPVQRAVQERVIVMLVVYSSRLIIKLYKKVKLNEIIQLPIMMPDKKVLANDLYMSRNINSHINTKLGQRTPTTRSTFFNISFDTSMSTVMSAPLC
jgi:hypothetical protein